jgi:hypothetical protein
MPGRRAREGAGVVVSTTSRSVVLVEGASDLAAVEVLASRRGLMPGRDLTVVSAAGVTNFPRLVAEWRRVSTVRLAGLYDVAEVGHVARALSTPDRPIGRADLAGVALLGFHACDRDLEDELIRAVGVEGALAVLERDGELVSFERMSAQPAQRDRPIADRLHRFLGTRATRKVRYGRLLAEATHDAALPEPLARLLADVVRPVRFDAG